jgi:hypothetical protein
MKWMARVLASLLVLLGLAVAISFALPAESKHTRVVALKQAPESVFPVLADVGKFPSWNRSVQKVEMLAPIDGKEATKQTFKSGMTMTVITTETLAPTHLVRTARDLGGNNFSGSWNYEITPTNDGCEVAVTEKSHIKNPMFRIIIRLFGSTRHIDQHLVDLARHFGETPVIWSKAPPAR